LTTRRRKTALDLRRFSATAVRHSDFVEYQLVIVESCSLPSGVDPGGEGLLPLDEGRENDQTPTTPQNREEVGVDPETEHFLTSLRLHPSSVRNIARRGGRSPPPSIKKCRGQSVFSPAQCLAFL